MFNQTNKNMLPESLYSYSTNFNRPSRGTKRPYVPAFKVKILDLLRPDWYYAIPSLERQVAILQFLCKTAMPYAKGTLYHNLKILLPNKYITLNNCMLGESAYEMSAIIQKKITELILRLDVGDDVWKWRVGTGLIDPNNYLDINIKTYRHRAAMPITSFNRFEDNVDNVLDKKITFLNWCPNSCHEDAVVIKCKGFAVGAGDIFYFIISYTSPDHLSGGWEVNIRSNPGETFVDFVLRLEANKKSIYEDGLCLEADGQYSPYYNLKSLE